MSPATSIASNTFGCSAAWHDRLADADLCWLRLPVGSVKALKDNRSRPSKPCRSPAGCRDSRSPTATPGGTRSPPAPGTTRTTPPPAPSTTTARHQDRYREPIRRPERPIVLTFASHGSPAIDPSGRPREQSGVRGQPDLKDGSCQRLASNLPSSYETAARQRRASLNVRLSSALESAATFIDCLVSLEACLTVLPGDRLGRTTAFSAVSGLLVARWMLPQPMSRSRARRRLRRSRPPARPPGAGSAARPAAGRTRRQRRTTEARVADACERGRDPLPGIPEEAERDHVVDHGGHGQVPPDAATVRQALMPDEQHHREDCRPGCHPPQADLQRREGAYAFLDEQEAQSPDQRERQVLQLSADS